jgi:hypothetical protein
MCERVRAVEKEEGLPCEQGATLTTAFKQEAERKKKRKTPKMGKQKGKTMAHKNATSGSGSRWCSAHARPQKPKKN